MSTKDAVISWRRVLARSSAVAAKAKRMVGLSNSGLYQRMILVLHGAWTRRETYAIGVGAPERTAPLVMVAIDLTQSLWMVCGGDRRAARNGFLGALSGRASKGIASIFLETPKGQIEIFEYFMNQRPRSAGKAFRNETIHSNGARCAALFAQQTYWWRYDDPAVAPPYDRMAEVFDRAARSAQLETRGAGSFGALISQEALPPLSAIFAHLFGAEFQGGAAAVRRLAGMMGFDPRPFDRAFYEARGRELHHICMGAAVPKDLARGAIVLREMLNQLIRDAGRDFDRSQLSLIAARCFSYQTIPDQILLRIEPAACEPETGTETEREAGPLDKGLIVLPPEWAGARSREKRRIFKGGDEFRAFAEARGVHFGCGTFAEALSMFGPMTKTTRTLH